MELQKSVLLIGLMGSGKTAVGRLMAQQLGRDFTDSDKVIEDEAGLRITDIFELYGEAKFRDMEHRIISRLVAAAPQIISTGGGAFTQAKVRDAVAGKVTSLWLRATPETLLSRMDNLSTRPLLAGDNPLAILQKLHEARFNDYAKADIIVDTDGLSLRAAADKVTAALSAHITDTDTTHPSSHFAS